MWPVTLPRDETRCFFIWKKTKTKHNFVFFLFQTTCIWQRLGKLMKPYKKRGVVQMTGKAERRLHLFHFENRTPFKTVRSFLFCFIFRKTTVLFFSFASISIMTFATTTRQLVAVTPPLLSSPRRGSCLQSQGGALGVACGCLFLFFSFFGNEWRGEETCALCVCSLKVIPSPRESLTESRQH